MRKAPAKAPPDCLNAGWSPSAWGRVIGQQIDNRYRAFADPRAAGQLLGFQSGIDLWRGDTSRRLSILPKSGIWPSSSTKGSWRLSKDECASAASGGDYRAPFWQRDRLRDWLFIGTGGRPRIGCAPQDRLGGFPVRLGCLLFRTYWRLINTCRRPGVRTWQIGQGGWQSLTGCDLRWRGDEIGEPPREGSSG